MGVLDVVEKAIENSKRVTSKISDLQSLQVLANVCKGCELHLGRTNVVFSKGDHKSNVMVIGMAPAKEEDKKGVPFVGKSGKFLNKMFVEAGIREEDIYITNVVKCYLKPGKPIKNKCADACKFYLKKQIEVIKPSCIVALGKDATITVYEIFNVENARNIKLETTQKEGLILEGVKVYSTYHPQFLARFGGKNTKYYRRAMKVLKELKTYI